MHESFLSQNIFHESKTSCCDFSFGMELENEKTKPAITFAYCWMAGYWPRFLFAKTELGQYPVILSLRLLNNIDIP